jgi:hypothetical protein
VGLQHRQTTAPSSAEVDTLGVASGPSEENGDLQGLYGNAFAAGTLGLSSSGPPPEDGRTGGGPIGSAAGGLPGWAAESRAHVVSVHGYAQFQALLLAWAGWGVEPEQTDGALQVVRSTFELSQETLRRGADSIERDGGTDIDSDIEAYQSLLAELADAALVAHQPPDETVEGLFLLLGQMLAEFDPAYQAGGGAKADPLLQTLLGILGDTLAGDFVQDPHLAAIVLRTLIGLIPYVDQAMDLQDIVAGLYHLTWEGQIDSPTVWVGLVLTLLGCIPELGSVLKGLGKGGVELVKQAVRRGSGAIPVDALLELLGDAGKRLDLEGKLAALLEQWTKISAQFDVGAIVGSMVAKVSELLDRVESGAKRARDLVQGLAEQAQKKFDEVAANARKAKAEAEKNVSEGVQLAKSRICDLVYMIQGRIALPGVKDALGEQALDALVASIGKDNVLILCSKLRPDTVQVLATKLGSDLGGLEAGRIVEALRGLPGATITAFERLDGEQMKEFLDPKRLEIRDAFRELPADEQVEILKDIRQIDKVFQTPKGPRAGHAMTEHGPHIPDEYLFERAAKLKKAVSRWSSAEVMEQAIAESTAKLTDEVYLVRQMHNGDCDMFTAAFWEQLTNPKKKNAVTIRQVLDDPVTHQNFLKDGNVKVKGTLPGAGQQFHTDGTTITDTDNYEILFKWDSQWKLHMLTGYPTK